MKIVELMIGILISFAITYVAYPKWINYLKIRNVKQTASEYALAEYQEKLATPMFGGVLFVIIPSVLVVLRYNIALSLETLLALMVFLAYFLLGVIDDY